MNDRQMTTLNQTLATYGFDKDGDFWSYENTEITIVVEIAEDEQYYSVNDNKTEDEVEYSEWSKVSEIVDMLERYLD